MAATYVVTIGGVTVSIQAFTLRISEQQNVRSRATFDVLSTAGSYRPALDALVIITENGTRIFCGPVVSVKETGHPQSYGGAAIVNHIEVADLTSIAERRYINVTIPDGTSLYDALNTYILPYFAVLFTSLSGSQANPGPTLPELRYEYVVGSDVLDDIALHAGNWAREINFSNELRVFDPSGSFAPFNIVANDGHIIGDVSVEPSRERYCNRAIVRFNAAAVQAYAFLDGRTVGAIADTNTVVIGSRTYTFQSTLTDVNGNVQVGGSLGDSLNNLIAAINGSGGGGSAYAASTTVNSQVEALLQEPSMMRVRARTGGAAGNSIGISTTTTLVWITEGAIPTSTLALGGDESLSNVVVVDDAVEQAANGIYEDVITADTDAAPTATARGTAYLVERTPTRKKVTYTTRTLGIHPGQAQSINLPRRNINNTFLVQSVETYEGKRGVLHRDVVALEGTVVQSSWQDTYRQWSSGGGTVGSSSGGVVVVSGGGAKSYFLGGSAVEAVRSATPTWVAASAVQVAIDTVERGTTSATVTVRLMARAGGVSVQARLYNVSNNSSAGESTVVTSTSWQTLTFAVTLTAGSQIYELQVLPGTANKDVSAVAYLE